MDTILDYIKRQYGIPDTSQQQVAGTGQTVAQLMGAPDLSQPPQAQPDLTAPMPSMPQMAGQVPLSGPIQAPTADPQTAPTPPSIFDRLKAAMADPGVARMLLSAGAGLMAAGGPSDKPVGTGQALAAGINQGGTAFDQYRRTQLEQQAQKQAMAANQWTTLTPAQVKAAGYQDPGPGYQLQKNGNGELRSVGQDVIRSSTDQNGLPTLVDDRHLGQGGSVASGVPKTVDATVDLIGKYQVPLQTALARVPWAVRGMVQQKLLEKYPGYQAENFTMYNKGYRDFGTGQQGNTVRSMNAGIAHLDTLGSLADALHNGNLPMVNKIANMWKTQTGQAAPTNFDAAKNIVAQELVKAITGYPGAASDREAAAAEISKDSSPEALRGTIDTYQKLLAGQLMGLKGQYQHSTGRDDFEQAMKLNPETLSKLGYGTDSASAIPAGWTVVQH